MIMMDDLDKIKLEIDEKIKEIGDKYDIQLKAGHVIYDKKGCTFEIYGKNKPKDVKAFSQVSFEKYCELEPYRNFDNITKFVCCGEICYCIKGESKSITMSRSELNDFLIKMIDIFK